MRPTILISILTSTLPLTQVGAQEPPRPLPGSITGNTTPQTVVPAAAVAPTPRPAPMARYQNLNAFPPETVQSVFGMRTAAEWLVRMQQPHGRFLHGLKPSIKMPLDGDNDCRQALATWAVCQSARFTNDEKLLAVGTQAVLSLMTLTQDDALDPACRCVKTTNSNVAGFTAALALAIYDLPTADARLRNEADRLCQSLRKKIQGDGSVNWNEGPADSEGGMFYPGLVLQALAASHRARPDPAKMEVLTRSLAYYRTAFRSKPHPLMAGMMIPAAVDLYIVAPDKDLASMTLEMADWICASQYGKTDVRNILWSGGFRVPGETALEPGFESAYATRGLAAATFLTRQIPDLTRYAKYRVSLVDALGFVRGLQYTAENADHFEPKFRAHYLIGGMRLAAMDGTLRMDATAAATLAYIRYLESGADLRD